ncbi:hypothetical protein J4G33_10130 [Actinotalea sp. BY-33]|uniref:Uncharacterized protein n=1 Tax=Actinotalea soli TaxID=2819234 RepID=A0A939LQG6_9CELL|nr:hypothetical protein [Actinotalea soli]MBO1752159.1 hypothetical protein [Actinotalea soli]
MGDLLPAVMEWFRSQYAGEQINSVAAIIALAGVAISGKSLANSRKALKLSEEQEKRRAAKFNLTVGRSYYESLDGGRSYFLTLLVDNPSDSPGAVSSAELWIAYQREGILMRLALEPGGVPLGDPGGEATRPPFDVSARSAVSVQLVFEAKPGLLNDRGLNIEAYELVAKDALGNSYNHHFPGLINRGSKQS